MRFIFFLLASEIASIPPAAVVGDWVVCIYGLMLSAPKAHYNLQGQGEGCPEQEPPVLPFGAFVVPTCRVQLLQPGCN